MKNVDVNEKNQLTKLYVIKDLFGILVTMNVNVINHVTWRRRVFRLNCKCRKKIVDELVEKCSENIDKIEMIYNVTLNDFEKVYGSCTI